MGSRGRLALAVVAALMLPASARAGLPQPSGAVDLLTQANVRIDGPVPNGSASGFRIDGPGGNDGVGQAVAGAGDVNGDGLADVIVGAHGVNTFTGAAYVVFGKASPGEIDLAALGAGGIRIDGAAPADNAGYRVAGGDVNGDGRSDVVVGALNASPAGRAFAGSAFEILGFGTPAIAYGARVAGTVG